MLNNPAILGNGLEPEERLFAALVRQAIRDAQRSKSPQLRDDALHFLWTVAPLVAVRLNLPQKECKNEGK